MSPVVFLALFINGVQAILPAPAFVESGLSWVPARVVFERLGCEISWDAGRGVLSVRGADGRNSCYVKAGMKTEQNGVRVVDTYKIWHNNLYIPAKSLERAAGCLATWDAASKRLYIETGALPEGQCSRMTVGDVLAEGPNRAGVSAIVEGEYLGWAGESNGAAAAEGEWLLRGEGGTLRCRSDAAIIAPFDLTPYGHRGRRLQLRGVIHTSAGGGTLLRVVEAKVPESLAGMACFIEVVDGGHNRLNIDIIVRNDSYNTINIPRFAPCLVAYSTQGEQISIVLDANVAGGRLLQAGERLEIAGKWDTSGLPRGVYRLRAEVGPSIRSYETPYRLED